MEFELTTRSSEAILDQYIYSIQGVHVYLHCLLTNKQLSREGLNTCTIQCPPPPPSSTTNSFCKQESLSMVAYCTSYTYLSQLDGVHVCSDILYLYIYLH